MRRSGKFFLITLNMAVLMAWFAFTACPSPGSAKGHRPAADSLARGVIPGAEVLLTGKLSLLKGKRVALIANPTSVLRSGMHLADSLIAAGVQLKKIFGPEHGFRGDHGAGEKVKAGTDEKTGLPLVSLYGATKKPTPEMLADVDVVLFDIQDVGTRFYTYSSTLCLAMEACAQQGKSMIVLDRPNPNGFYVQGPVMESACTSFVGLYPGVPVVHGMTMGEFALMVNKEGWLAGGKQCSLTVIPCQNYHHSMRWEQTGLKWVPPSPNLASEYAAYLYPVLCWYEGMPVSVGRGTDFAFEIAGAPWHNGYHDQLRRDSAEGRTEAAHVQLRGLEMEVIRFTPRSIPDKAPDPPFRDKECYGVRFLNRTEGDKLFLAGLDLLINFYEESKNVHLKEPAFIPYFEKLAGTARLRNDIIAGKTADEIFASWQPGLETFKRIRSKYLLYGE